MHVCVCVCVCASVCACMLSVYSVYFPNAIDVYMYPLFQHEQSLMILEDTGFSFSHVSEPLY